MMIKAVNESAKNGYLQNVKDNSQNICVLCDTRDSCTHCDSEWCAPFVKDWV